MKKRIGTSSFSVEGPSSRTLERMTPKKAIDLVVENWQNFATLPTKLSHQREFLIRALRSDCRIYGVLPLELRADKEVLLVALERGGFSNYVPLGDAPSELLDDIDVIKKSISKHLATFNLASERIKTTPSIVCELFAANAELFRILPFKLRDNRKVLSAALAQNCGAFYHASERLRNDRALVTSCLKPGGIRCNLLANAGDALRNDRRLVEKAIDRFGGGALCAASARLRMDRDLVKKALLAGLRWSPHVFPNRWVSKDRELALLAIKHSSWMAFADVDSSLKKDVDFCIEAAHANPNCIPAIPGSIRRRAAFKKAVKWDSGPTANEIREAFEKALDGPHTSRKISGQGHDPRVTLNNSVAAALRQLDLPRVYKSGFGAKWLYPASLVSKAARILDVPMESLTGL